MKNPKSTGLVALLLLANVESHAAKQLTVQMEQHSDTVRLSFPYKFFKSVASSPGIVRLSVANSVKNSVRLPSAPNKGLQSLYYHSGVITLNLAPGAKGRQLRIGQRLIYDIRLAEDVPKQNHDQGDVRASQADRRPPPADFADVKPQGRAYQIEPSRALPAIEELQPAPLANVESGRQASPELSQEPGLATVALLAAADGDVGVAVLRRGGRVILVFDKNIELSAEPAVTLSSIGAQQDSRGETSVISLEWPEVAAVSLSRNPRGWSISGQEMQRPLRSFLGASTSGQVEIPFDSAGHVVSILDPDTDTPLLVGTVLSTSGNNQSSHALERAPGFSILPSEYGVFVEPTSDMLELKPTANGFILSGALQAAQDHKGQFGGLVSQSFEFAAVSMPGQLQKLSAQIAGAAGAPVRSRAAQRVAVAQTQISLGLGAEAVALLHLAQTEDPSLTRNPEFNSLLAIGALISDQPVDGTIGAGFAEVKDDVSFWRGVQKAQASKAKADAAALYKHVPLLMTYLPTLRSRLLPWIVESALLDSNPRAFLDLPEAEQQSETLRFAKAMQLELSGDRSGAMSIYEEVSRSPDFRDQVRAAARLAELRFAAGQMTAREAARVIESQAFVWRGDELEAQLKIRSAKLLEQGEAWRPALESLRNAKTLPVVQGDSIMLASVQQQMQEVLQAFVASSARAVTPVETVALLEDFGGELSPGFAADQLQRLKAEKLLSLEMPEKAIPILSALVKEPSTPLQTADIGNLLAQALLEAGRLEEVKPALQSTTASQLPSALIERRGCVQARAEMMLNQSDGAEATLLGLHSTAADTLRVQLFSSKGDWRRVAGALKDIADRDLPAEGPLSEQQQDLIVRLVGAANDAGLSDLTKEVYATRMRQMNPSRAKILNLLVPSPSAAKQDGLAVRQDVASAKDVSAYRFPGSK